MIKVFNLILVLGTLLYADIFETKNRIGLSVSPGVLCDVIRELTLAIIRSQTRCASI